MHKRTSWASIVQSDWRVNIGLFKSACKIIVKSSRFSFEGGLIHGKTNKWNWKDNFYKKTIKINWKTKSWIIEANFHPIETQICWKLSKRWITSYWPLKAKKFSDKIES